MGQTESLSRVMRERSEDLQDGPMSKLTLLIKDKQQLRKSYGEQWSLLSQEHSKVMHTHMHVCVHMEQLYAIVEHMNSCPPSAISDRDSVSLSLWTEQLRH